MHSERQNGKKLLQLYFFWLRFTFRSFISASSNTNTNAEDEDVIFQLLEICVSILKDIIVEDNCVRAIYYSAICVISNKMHVLLKY